MKPSEVKQQLRNAFTVKTPVFVWGAPGVGKSDVMRQLTKELNVGLIDQRLSQMDSADLRGIPFVNKEEMIAYWSVAGFLPQEERDGKEGVLFLDEMNSAPPAVSAAAYQLVLDRGLGDYKLPDGWVVFAAGNRAEDRAIVNRMPTPLANRFGHVTMDVDLDEWVQWAIQQGMDNDLVSFIKYRPELLHKIDYDQSAFPTGRTWEMVNKHIPLISPKDEHKTFTTYVGKGAAGEFAAFKTIARELPALEVIIANPETAPLSGDPAIIYAVSGMLAFRATDKTFAPIMKYIERVEPEYQAMFMQEVGLRNEDLLETQEFTSWSVKNASTIL